MSDPNIQPLIDALSLTPDNSILRLHITEQLLKAGQHQQAEDFALKGIQIDPQNVSLKYALARAYSLQVKSSAALVILEEIYDNTECPAQALMMYSQLLAQTGDLDQASRVYERCIDRDESLKNEAFEAELGYEDPETTFNEFMADDEEDKAGHAYNTHQQPDAELNANFEKPSIDFESVGGMDAVKEEIRLKIIHPMNHPEIYEAFGKKVGGGILLYGPPGCGKTHIARATAGECKANFLSIGLHDVLDMYIGNSEQKLHKLFEFARQNQPCVLFFDEIDALGASRTDMKNSAGRYLINQFLAELDGMSANNEGLLILGATNAPWHLDTAFRRPGRFDRIILVPPPDHQARAVIMELMLEGKPQENINFSNVTKKLESYSGADLKAIVDIAVEDKLRLALKSGLPTPIVEKDLIKAGKRHKASTKEWFSTARNYALYSNESGLYDEILEYLKITK